MEVFRNITIIRIKRIGPFDKNRQGFVIGEGSGVVLMENIERAEARGSNILAVISGVGNTCDGKDRINPDPSGNQLARAIRMALNEAEITPDEIDYISLDGFAVEVWDHSEAKAIKHVFGEKAKTIPVSCPKSMFGNLLGASGAVDLIATILAMEHNVVPPTINVEAPDPEGLNYIINKAHEKEINKALVISRGRGGINTVIVIEKKEVA